MRIKRKMITGAILFVTGIATSHAALIGVNDYGNYFSDTTSGLDWLDVTASINRSYVDVSSQFGSAGDFAGWRYATAAEFGAMIDNTTGLSVGITGINQFGFTPETGTELRELIALFGDTWNPQFGGSYCTEYPSECVTGDMVFTRGFLSDSNPKNPLMHYAGFIKDDDLTTSSVDGVSVVAAYDGTGTRVDMGSFLVRDTMTVPEPASLALMGLGLLGIGFSRKKMR